MQLALLPLPRAASPGKTEDMTTDALAGRLAGIMRKLADTVREMNDAVRAMVNQRLPSGSSATWVWIRPGERKASGRIHRGQAPPIRCPGNHIRRNSIVTLAEHGRRDGKVLTHDPPSRVLTVHG